MYTVCGELRVQNQGFRIDDDDDDDDDDDQKNEERCTLCFVLCALCSLRVRTLVFFLEIDILYI